MSQSAASNPGIGNGTSVGPASTGSAGGQERILAVTVAALSELDASALSIQRICDRASVTPPTLYYHFGSKDGLIAAAVDRMLTDWIEMFGLLGDQAADLATLTDQAVEGWVEMITSPSRPCAVFVWIAMWSPESREGLLHARSRAQAVIRGAIVGQLGQFDEVDGLAALILDGVLAAAVDFQLDADEDGLRRRLTTMAAAAGLAAQHAADPAYSRP